MSKREITRDDLENILVEKKFVSQEMCKTGFIQMDSIQYIDLIVEIEEAYDIEIPDEFLTPNNTWELDVLVKVIRSALKQKSLKGAAPQNVKE